MTDLYKEHQFHTSDDWANLKNECSDCYNSIKSIKKLIPSIDVYEKNIEALSGRKFDEYICKPTNY